MLKNKLQELYHNDHTFSIYQSEDALSVTSDSVALVDFITIRKSDNLIVDIGSGIGTIPILLATKTSKKIIGFEIQKDLATLSRKSIAYNQLENQISIIPDKIQNCRQYLTAHSVDVIVSNPPYFKVEKETLFHQSTKKTIARHEVELTFSQLVENASKLLKHNGTFFFIHQTDRLIEIIEVLKTYRLEPKKIQFIYPTKKKGSSLFLLEAQYEGKSGLKIEKPLIRKEDS